MATARRNAKSDAAERNNDEPVDQFEGIEPDEYGRVPGDVRTEPVATAAQTARPDVAGRVGPPTIAQDASAEWHTPPGVTQIEPGDEAPADTPQLGGPVELDDVVDEYDHDVSPHKASGERLAARGDEHKLETATPPSGPVAK